MEFIDKTVIITGGTGGIGSELAKKMVEKGASVIVFDKMPAVSPIAGIEYHQVDITVPAAMEESFKKVNRKIDILINNAGIMRRGDIFDTSETDYDLVMDINLKGMWLTIKYAKPYLSEDAVVFLMSSRHGMTVKADPAIYSLSKHAVWGLAEILKKTAPLLKVKVAYPGSVDTPLTWTQVKEEDVEAKKKTVVSPELIAGKLMELIGSDYEKLVFDEDSKEYVFE